MFDGKRRKYYTYNTVPKYVVGAECFDFCEDFKRMTKKTKIAVIDYGAGNLYSVEGGLKRAGAEVAVINNPAAIGEYRGIVLPGVGAFGYAADMLKKSGFFDAVKTAVSANIPLLGICLGMQLMFESSEESAGVQGLSLLKGEVTRLKAGKLKIPHMGWTRLGGCKGRLLDGVSDGEFAYFVHSFGVHSCECNAATAEYGEPFTAAAECGNVFATQFHPEKSSETGHKILCNFVSICGEESL